MINAGPRPVPPPCGLRVRELRFVASANQLHASRGRSVSLVDCSDRLRPTPLPGASYQHEALVSSSPRCKCVPGMVGSRLPRGAPFATRVLSDAWRHGLVEPPLP